MRRRHDEARTRDPVMQELPLGVDDRPDVPEREPPRRMRAEIQRMKDRVREEGGQRSDPRAQVPQHGGFGVDGPAAGSNKSDSPGLHRQRSPSGRPAIDEIEAGDAEDEAEREHAGGKGRQRNASRGAGSGRRQREEARQQQDGSQQKSFVAERRIAPRQGCRLGVRRQ